MFYHKLSSIFLPQEKRRFFGLMAAILVLSLLEVVGVASILPFMELVANPAAIQANPWLNQAYELGRFSSERQMLIASGVIVIVLITCSNIFGIFTLWSQHRFTWNMAHRLGMRLLRSYLVKPYAYYLRINTAELKSYLIGEVGVLTSGVLLPLIELISRGTIALVIFALLIYVSPLIALSSFLLLGGVYLLIYLLRQRTLQQLGEERITHNVERYQSLAELLNGIKTIKANNLQSFFYERYADASQQFAAIMPRFQVIMQAPRYILEIVAFGGILTITLVMYLQNDSFQQALPILSLYAVAGYRLLPALQRSFAALSKLRHNLPVLDKLHADLQASIEFTKQEKYTPPPSLSFQQSIDIRQLTFSYEEAQEPVLQDFNLSIPKGQVVAFVGSTGSGKTTLVDVLAGLLAPQRGQILVDGQVLTQELLPAWAELMTYVPQHVFLFDDTLLQNIAIPLPGQEADLSRAQAAARMASLAEFIDHELPDGYHTLIGDKGVRLSGGQQQRLGLARALYRQPEILILDEATSALDNITEQRIVDALEKLPTELTLIIVAHRLSTVRRADCIYFLRDGKIFSSGTYDELVASDETFRNMVELS